MFTPTMSFSNMCLELRNCDLCVVTPQSPHKPNEIGFNLQGKLRVKVGVTSNKAKLKNDSVNQFSLH